MSYWERFYASVTAEIARLDPDHQIRVIGVTGGREGCDWRVVSFGLDAVNQWTRFDTLIHGAALGLDTQAGDWATKHRKTSRALPARWKRDPVAAGPLRNTDMMNILLDHSPRSALVAFPGGNGTADMTAKCNLAGLPVIDLQFILDELEAAARRQR